MLHSYKKSILGTDDEISTFWKTCFFNSKRLRGARRQRTTSDGADVSRTGENLFSPQLLYAHINHKFNMNILLPGGGGDCGRIDNSGKDNNEERIQIENICVRWYFRWRGINRRRLRCNNNAIQRLYLTKTQMLIIVKFFFIRSSFMSNTEPTPRIIFRSFLYFFYI